MAMALAGLQTAVAGSVSIYPAMPESTLRKRVAGRARSRCRGGGDARDERLLVSSMSQVDGFNFDISEVSARSSGIFGAEFEFFCECHMGRSVIQRQWNQRV